jgi:hypothetical protein
MKNLQMHLNPILRNGHLKVDLSIVLGIIKYGNTSIYIMAYIIERKDNKNKNTMKP